MYTIINALIVTDEASYISAQIHGETADEAWRAALLWVSNRNEREAHVNTACPVYFKVNGISAPMEHYTVGACLRDLALG